MEGAEKEAFDSAFNLIDWWKKMFHEISDRFPDSVDWYTFHRSFCVTPERSFCVTPEERVLKETDKGERDRKNSEGDLFNFSI